MIKRLRNLLKAIPNLDDDKLREVHNDLSRASVVMYMGAPDRVLNLCNECLDAIDKERERRRKAGGAI